MEVCACISKIEKNSKCQNRDDIRRSETMSGESVPSSFYFLVCLCVCLSECGVCVCVCVCPCVKLRMKAGNKNSTGHFLQT